MLMRVLLRFCAGLLVLAICLGGLWKLSGSRSFQLFGGLVTRVETTAPVVALTFDDGPTPAGTDTILSILARSGVRATFFLTGAELERHPEAGRQILQAGHEVGNHSYSHRRMVLRSPAFIRQEVERTDSLIRALGYTGPIAFRPPYGKRLFALPLYLHQQQRLTLLWDVEPDSDPEIAGSAERIASDALRHARPGSIILLHVMYPSRAESRRAVPMIIRGLQSRGFRFVTLSELLPA